MYNARTHHKEICPLKEGTTDFKYIRSKIGYNIKSADFFFLDFSLSNMMHDCIWILILWRIKGRGGGVVFDE